MKIRMQFILRVLLFGLVSLSSYANPLDCTKFLESPEHVAAFRKELIASADAYHLQFSKQPERWSAENIEEIGRESQLYDAARFTEGHVVNLAGLSDTLRMLYDFPLAEHFHIVDTVQTFAGTITNGVYEFLERVTYLGGAATDGSPVASVEILSRGFLDLYAATIGLQPYGPTESDEKNFFDLTRSEAKRRQPLILRVTWQSPSLGKIVKQFYYHPNDLTRPQEIAEFLLRIPTTEPLHGVFIYGVELGSHHSRSINETYILPILKRIHSGGLYITPLYRDRRSYSGFRERKTLLSDLGFQMITIRDIPGAMIRSPWDGYPETTQVFVQK